LFGNIIPGRKSCITLEINEKIENTIHANPDITLTELIEELKLSIGVSRLSQILKSWKYSLKKKDTPSDHAETRRCDKKTFAMAGKQKN
jgi:transposase